MGRGRRWVVGPLVATLVWATAGAVTAVRSEGAPIAVSIASICDGAPSAGFTDTRGSTFRAEIDCLAWYGLTEGTGDGTTFDPDAAVSRSQMAVFLWRTATMIAGDDGTPLPTPVDAGFDDVGALPAATRTAIDGLAALGVVEGVDGGRYDPWSAVRRDQMASFVNRTQGGLQALRGGDPRGYTSSGHFFPDVSPGNVHAPNIDGLASRGIVEGRADGRYVPAVAVTRGQMAAYLVRWLQVVDADAGR